MKTAMILFLAVITTVSLFAGEWDPAKCGLIFLSALFGALVWTALFWGTMLLGKE